MLSLSDQSRPDEGDCAGIGGIERLPGVVGRLIDDQPLSEQLARQRLLADGGARVVGISRSGAHKRTLERDGIRREPF
jgi:hypothetical protein